MTDPWDRNSAANDRIEQIARIDGNVMAWQYAQQLDSTSIDSQTDERDYLGDSNEHTEDEDRGGKSCL